VDACDVVTYEFENIPVEPLWEIEKLALLHPHSNVLEVCQNRMREKTWLLRNAFLTWHSRRSRQGRTLRTR